MFESAVHQLRYAADLLRGRLQPETLRRIAADLVATRTEFGTLGGNPALPEQQVPADPETQRAMARRSLLRTAREAGEHTAYYRRLFAALGMRPHELTADDWATLPVTPKSALRGMPAAFVSARSAPVLLATTTGTTGAPTRVWFSAAELDVFVALNTIAFCLPDGIRPHHVVAHTASSRATLSLTLTAEACRRVGTPFLHLGTLDPELTLERLAAPLDLPGKAAQPTHLTTTATYLGALIAQAEHDGWRRADFGLLSMQSGGEIVTDALRERAAEAFGPQITASYMATEIMPVGAVRCSRGHLHYAPQYGLVELLDPVSHEAAAPGAVAVIVVTPYAPYRDCTLLLRYVTGDLVEVLAGEPGCELADLPASSDILGRYTGPLSIRVPTRAILDVLEAEQGVPLPARYAVVDDPAGPLLHVAVKRPTSALLGRLEEGAARSAPGLAGIVLHGDPRDLPGALPVRADLRELSFERTGRGRLAPVGSEASA